MKSKHFTGVKTGRLSEGQWEGISVHSSKKKAKKNFGSVLSGVVGSNLVMKERLMYLVPSFSWRPSEASSGTRYPKSVCLVAELGEERCDQKKNRPGTT